MTARFRDDIPQIVAGIGGQRFTSLVDVGGGQGNVLAAILDAHPGMRGQLVDLAPSADARTFHTLDLSDRAEAIPGSFFDPLPAGADAYLLFDILHNWDDEHAHKILARCAEAAHPGSRILVIEAVGGLRASSEFDLVMLVFYGGRDRSLDEFRALAADHGLTLDTVTELTAQRCLLEFTVAAGGR